jgi:lysophospholipase L1-like esterase
LNRLDLRTILTSLLLIAIASILQITSVTSAAEAGGWFDAKPTLQYDTELTSGQVLKNSQCTNMTVTVVSNIFSSIVSNEQQICMVSTSAGLISAGGTIIQPNGFSKAYAIKDFTPGNNAFIPVANQATVMLIHGDRAFPGVNVSIYKNFYSHLKFNIFSQRFELYDQPDVTLKYSDGREMPFNTSTMTISEDGRFVVVDLVYQGYVRIDLSTYEVMPFAPTLPRDSANDILSSATAIDSTGRYAAIGYGWDWGSKFFTITDLDTCTSKLATDNYSKSVFSCKTVNYFSYLQSQIPGFQSVSGLRFTNDHVLITDVYVGNHTYKRYILTAAGTETSREQYLAMGDSYISGEGAYDYRAGTDTDVNKCHQSLLAYPELFAGKFSSSASVACSGAVVDNIIGNDDKNHDYQLRTGEIPPSPDQQALAKEERLPGVVKQNDFVGQDNPEVVTLSIGGNDVGFSDIVKKCIVPFNKFSSASQNCYQTYEDRLELVNTVNSTFDSLYKTYLAAKGDSHNRRVYVIGYPQVVSPTADSCALNLRMSAQDRQFAAELVAYLDSVIERAADKAGVQYVDTQDAFDGHKLCDDTKNVAVNGLTEGNDAALIIGNESYHPNALGHQLLADKILASTHNLTTPMPAADVSVTDPKVSPDLPILQAPKENRVVYEVLNATQDIVEVINWAAPTSVSISSFSGTLLPNSVYTAVLHSTPVQLGTVKTDASGEIHAQLTVPTSVDPGYHTIHFYGKNLAGDPVDIQKLVYVEFSNDDYDGDGVVNAADSCLSLPDSGVDADKDGIDDACDAVISDPPIPVVDPIAMPEPSTQPDPSTPPSAQSSPSPIAQPADMSGSTMQPAAPITPTDILRLPKAIALGPTKQLEQQVVGVEDDTISTMSTPTVLGITAVDKPSNSIAQTARTSNHHALGKWFLICGIVLLLLASSCIGMRRKRL